MDNSNDNQQRMILAWRLILILIIGYQFDKPNYENIPHKQTRVGQTHEQLSIGQADDPQFSQGISKPNYQNIPHKQTTIGQTHEQLSIGQTDDPQFSQGISIGNDSQAILFENQGMCFKSIIVQIIVKYGCLVWK